MIFFLYYFWDFINYHQNNTLFLNILLYHFHYDLLRFPLPAPSPEEITEGPPFPIHCHQVLLSVVPFSPFLCSSSLTSELNILTFPPFPESAQLLAPPPCPPVVSIFKVSLEKIVLPPFCEYSTVLPSAAPKLPTT